MDTAHLIFANQQNTAQPLSLGEKLRRRQLALQQQQDNNEVFMTQFGSVRDHMAAQQFSGNFDAPNDFDYQQTAPKEMSAEVPGLNFSVDELVMDDDQRFHFTSTNTFI